MTEPEEITIINRVLDGETDVFGLLVEAYQGLLLRVIGGILNDQRHLAEEIAQDVLVEAFRRLPDFDSARSPFRSWLLMIARSRAINALRKRRPTYCETVPETPEMPPEPMADELQQLDAALHQLPAKQKRALLLSQVEGLPYRQIAEIENASVGTIKSRVSRAPRISPSHPNARTMKEKDEHDPLLEQWTKYRCNTPGDTGDFTREVMGRIAAGSESERSVPGRTAPRLQRLALTTTCAAAGIGKFLIVLRLAV